MEQLTTGGAETLKEVVHIYGQRIAALEATVATMLAALKAAKEWADSIEDNDSRMPLDEYQALVAAAKE